MSSSPELISRHPRARSGSTRPQFNGKGKSRNHTVSIASNIIELTDSENDEDLEPSKKSSRSIASEPARSRRQATPKPFGASSSSVNKPSTSNQREPRNEENPTSLPSDEENVPPSREPELPPIAEDFAMAEPVPINHLDAVQDRVEHANQVVEPVCQQDPVSSLVAQVLEVVPDVQPNYVTELISQRSTASFVEILEAVLHVLFDAPYPKVDKKGKRKSLDNDEEGQRKRPRLDDIDYAQPQREYKGGVHYSDLSIEHLMVDFPDIPKPHIRKILCANKCLYAPTHLHFLEEIKRGPPFAYVPKKTHYRPSKGKQRALEDAEFERERAWLLEKLKEDKVQKNADVAEQINEQEYAETGDGIECGCCFSTYPFDKMIQCPDAHLFCSECMSSYAENLLGSHNININCMDQSGCKLAFPLSELRRFLSDKLLELYERVKQRKEIEMAGLEGLEECPFCEYKCVIENPEEKLFRCGNEETCGAITCRQCKKMDHLPKSCKEMEEDKLLDGRHLIEEAMTRALMRNCPQCQKSFVKEDGCNKMTCPQCRTLSCYVCRKVIQGYDHFNQRVPGAVNPAGGTDLNKCPLWEPVETRHAAEVQAAAKKALEEYKLQNPDVDEKEVQVEVTPPRPPNPAIVDPHGYGRAGMPRQNPYAPLQLPLPPQLPDMAQLQRNAVGFGRHFPYPFNHVPAPLPAQIPAQIPARVPARVPAARRRRR